MVKLSELTPLTTAHLVALLAEAGLPSGVVGLMLGDGAAGAALVAHPDVDLVSFTDGTATGRGVLRAAADTVTRVHCELGGKNPNVVFPDVDVDVVVDNALHGAFLHAGQVCSAGSRLVVHADVHDAVVAGLVAGAAAIRLGDGRDDRTQSGPLISAAQRARTERMVAGALAEGAVLAAGGRRPDEPALRNGFFYRPTVLTGCRRDMAVVREEVRRAGRRRAALRHGVDQRLPPVRPRSGVGRPRAVRVGRELGPTGLAEYRELKHVWRRRTPGPSGWLT
ncbi:aldehyde dehydrogenase family protein [Geodermatophilus sp. CPCC 205761]